MKSGSIQTRRLLLLLAAAVVGTPALHAQTGLEGPAADQSHATVAPRAVAARGVGPIQIDGRLDDGAWQGVQVIRDFTQLDPREGAPVSERTEVRIVYDEQAIYIGAMLYDSAPVTTRLARRDSQLGDSDSFIVLLDSYHDHQTAYRFATNPSGVKQDQLVSTGGSDASWDPIWEVATEVTAEGWSVEMQIPFSQLRFARDTDQVWGLQIERNIHRKQEQAVFSFTPKIERGGVPRYGHLEGIREIRAGRRLELLPYVAARAEYLQVPGSSVDFPNPFRSGSDYFSAAGLDLKYSITSNLTLDATINPDFGQVEVDPAVINLTAFETRFSEARPFFVEGAEIFRFSEGGPGGSTGRPPEVFYSRRIGRAPQGAVPGGAVFTDAPNATTILGAAKLTGKFGDGWSVGLLEAVTGRERARYVDSTGTRNDIVVEPPASYLVGRVRRDLNGGQTRFGLVATAVNRNISDPLMADRLHSAAYSAGVDMSHEWANRTWKLGGSFVPSYVMGEPAALTRTQRSSVRYFQRPDAEHLDVDAAASSMAGYYGMVDLNKQAGIFQMKIALGAVSPGFEINDIGFITAGDRLILDTHFVYNQTRPGRLVRNWIFRAGPDGVWNYDGDNVFAEFNISGNWQALNYTSGSYRIAFNPPTLNDRLTRGGPLAVDPQRYSGNLGLNSDSRKPYMLRWSGQWAVDEGDNWRYTSGLNLTYRPRGNWEVRVGPELTRSRNAAQYVTAVTDESAQDTFGRRYVFAGLDQTELGLETRVNVTFSPALSFELFAQPLLSSGRYGALKELRAPRTFDFLVYGEDTGSMERQADGLYRIDPDGDGAGRSFLVRDLDFNIRSLRGNAVLRWEWRAGSTLFLVWQQSRADQLNAFDADPLQQRIGTFDLGRDTRELFGTRPDNIFLIKLDYWLNP